MVRQVQPLRISKTTPASSPDKKMAAAARPLAEISSGSMRRNSPSYNQATRKMIVSRESSPYVENTSPHAGKPSPRDFWSTREGRSPSRLDIENTPDRDPSPGIMSAKRRASIERLQSASRVKNSKIFALEAKDAYDPESLPIVERPVVSRPMSEQFIRNSFTRFDSMRKENSPIRSPGRPGHKRTDSEISVPLLSPSKAAEVPLPMSPEKQASPSPTKSALSRNSQFGIPSPSTFDPETGAWSDEERVPTPRALHRHNKSVTFHSEPPVITEYEQQTPEPSISAASGSREGSWDSDDFYDQDVSFERGSSAEVYREDSFDEDLENADKTPVVLPEHWSRMSPDEARMDLVNEEDDVFEGSPEPTQRPVLGRSESVASDSGSRPLPQLPGLNEHNRRDSDALAAAAERASNAAKSLRSPPKRASASATDILNMTRQSSLSLQERLQLLSAQGDNNKRPESRDSAHDSHAPAEEYSICNLDEAEKMDVQVRVAETEVEDDSVLGEMEDFANAPPRISRESILRKVRNTKYDFEDEESELDQSELAKDRSPGRLSYAELARMDPDQPIPSRENSRETSETYLQKRRSVDYLDDVVEVKEEPLDDDAIDMSKIPAMDDQTLQAPPSPSRADDYIRQPSVLRHELRVDSEESEGSKYSSIEPEMEGTLLHQEQSPEPEDGKETLQDAMQLLTVKDYSSPSHATEQSKKVSGDFMPLPAYLSTNDYDFGMGKYITPSPPPSTESTQKLDTTNMPSLKPSASFQEILDLPRAPFANADASPPGTPESVIHHMAEPEEYEEYEDATLDFQDAYESPEPELKPQPEPIIPERKATIKTGGKLKARPSGTPADFQAMAEQRRMVSVEYPVPAIPQTYQGEIENSCHADIENADEGSVYSDEVDDSKADSAVDTQHKQQEATQKPERRRESRKIKLDLDIPAVEDDGWGLDEAFDRVIEEQKSQKGYLMRHNTKVVVASNRNVSGGSNDTVRSAEPTAPSTSTDAPRRSSSRGSKGSPRKPSAEQFLKTEPWNGKSRRKSVRNASAQKAGSGPAPPLPGQESALGVVSENAAGTGSLDEEVPEGVEKGRLFVKVVGVKDLALPMPRNDRIYFKLTLDNGLHCVTTAPLELGKNAPIGQEFELVVHNDLEFQLTLNTKLPPRQAPPPLPTPPSPTKSIQSSKSTGLSRLLMSPKKRAERERQEREAMEAEQRRFQEEAARKRASVVPTAWDQLHDLVNAADGSFARSYINLAAHEERCFGRPLTVDIPCYNEWALEKNTQIVNSVRSKRGTHAGLVRKPPYVVGALELQLLYVPRPKDSTDEEMPKSMSSAVREISRASEVKEITFEGLLSQQGGDCTHWRRRFFRLQNGRLTAYHEHTHQKRAVINLSKAVRLVDDRRTLVADPAAAASSPHKSGGRRKSAFAEEDEGYAYVEEGFRIRFANGETIDFYADSTAEKEKWMDVLAQVVGKPDSSKQKRGWTDLVLARERVEAETKAKSVSANGEVGEATGTEVRDFTKPPVPAVVVRQPSDRKPVSKSVPSSPVKGSSASGVPVGKRPGTPPLAPRQGHRSRDAVKSMIF